MIPSPSRSAPLDGAEIKESSLLIWPASRQGYLSYEQDAPTEQEKNSFPLDVAKMVGLLGMPWAWPSSGPFFDLWAKYRPGLAHLMPSRHALGGRLLNELYDECRESAEKVVQIGLQAGHGAVAFDGWENARGENLVNILLKLSTGSVVHLTSAKTGPAKCGAVKYAPLVEEVMGRYGGMSRIAGVTSDNTAACINAREMLTERRYGLSHANDQAHAPDLLMEDIGKLDWVGSILKKRNDMVTGVRSRKRLLGRLRELAMIHGSELKRQELLRANSPAHASHKASTRVELAKQPDARFGTQRVLRAQCGELVASF